MNAPGRFAGLSDETELSEPEAARFLGVGQLTLLGYHQSGRASRRASLGHRSLFTASHLRAFRRQRYGVEG